MRRVQSPDGRIEFRIFVAQPREQSLTRPAYQVLYRGKILIDTSFLGLEITDQEPILGENAGLTTSSSRPGGSYNSLTVEYLQNGSLGRRLNVEVRVSDNGIAFRYSIPFSTPLADLSIDDEDTEFALPHNPKAPLTLPFVVEEPGAGWVEIAEVPEAKFPRVSLIEAEGSVLVTQLASRYEGKTPFTCPWRVILIGADKESVGQTGVIGELTETPGSK